MITAHKIRRFVIITVVAAFALVPVAFVTIVVAFLLQPWGSAREFTGLPGKDAAGQLEQCWPSSVDPAQVQEVSHKLDCTIDSHSQWQKIVLSPQAAAAWQDDVHLREEQTSRSVLHRLHEGLEGVHRIQQGAAPALRRQTGSTPPWWSPPAIDFRATEVMLWYKHYDSGVARATYSGYDEATQTLWIYEYAAQHDRLWSPGCLPEGRRFSTLKRSDQQTPDSEDSSDEADEDREQ